MGDRYQYSEVSIQEQVREESSSMLQCGKYIGWKLMGSNYNFHINHTSKIGHV